MKRIAPLMLVLLLSACASYSGIAPEAKKLDASTLGTQEIKADWPRTDWWRGFGDETLDHLIDQALINSPGIQEADARLHRAQAIAGYFDSARYPQITANADVTRERFSENGLFPPPYAGTTNDINDLGLNASWELDFFGRNSEALKAAIGELRATEADHQAARILIAADVARNYYALARLQAQSEVIEALNRQRAEQLALTQQRVTAGIDAPGALDPLKTDVAENRRDTAAIDAQIAVMRHAIAALIGQGPDATANLQATLPATGNVTMPDSLPLDLLGHRADIVAAKWRVESNLHGLESEKAQFYPNINLLGFVGFSSIGTSGILTAANRQPSLGLAVSLPIFDAGRLRSEYRGLAAQTDLAITSYNQTLLNALRDVADQISTMQSLEQQLQRQQAAVESSQSALKLAQQRYEAGITNRQPVLSAEANRLQQDRALIDLQARWTDGRINLIRALGGGFTDNEQDNKAAINSGNNEEKNGAQHG
ncbi:MAG TPA: efflux transporter outer membrane subunit [Rhodocyclaceae bacterium]|nr:efflux transporter outer membrane subunit [Rhodocyclaceae bacterium]